MIERRSGAGRAYCEGTFLFTVGKGKTGAAYVHGDQGRATPSLKDVGFIETVRSAFVKEKIGALGLPMSIRMAMRTRLRMRIPLFILLL